MRRLRQIGWAVGGLPRGSVAAETGKGLVEGSGLDDAVIGKGLVRRRSNRQSGRRALAAGRLGRLDGASKGTNLCAWAGLVCVCRAALAVLLACFDNLPLALSYIEASLELLAHGGVLGVEARRQAGEADIVEVGGALARRACGEGARRVDNVVVGREVEALGPVSSRGGGHVGRRGLLLDDNLGSGAAGPARGGTVRHEGHDVSVRRGHGRGRGRRGRGRAA